MTPSGPQVRAAAGGGAGGGAPTVRLPDRTTTALAAAVAAACLVAGICYAWSIDRDPLEPYYAAAVRSMAGSWHDFVFGAFDPDGTVTLDKLPGAFWVQALSVRLFGVHTWAIVLPQVLAGIATVAVLYRAVRRLAGPAAGVLAAWVLAVSPATVALHRGNLPDPLMILLLVLAVDAAGVALLTGRDRALVLAGVWVGLAFQVKMVQAWLVLPALGAALLLAAAGPLRRRLRGLLLLGVVSGLVSLLWTAVVSLVPAGSRPWVDGSAHDSLLEQVFGYNGLGRFGQRTPLELLTGRSVAIPLPPSSPPGWNRLFTGPLGLEGGWLVPAALVAAIAVLVARRGQDRRDPVRAAVVLWAAWLLVLGAVFSGARSVNPYYAAALSPAVAALVGIGGVEAWRARRRPAVPLVAAVAVALSAAVALPLVPAGGRGVPGWLRTAVALLSVAACAGLAGAAFLARRGRAPAGDAAPVPRPVAPRTAVAGVAVAGVAVAAVLLAPVTASVAVVAQGAGALDHPFESPAAAERVHALFVRVPEEVRADLPALERARRGSPDLLVADTAAVASVFAYPSGDEVLPIGGFTGTSPRPTLEELRTAVAQGRFHLAVIGAGTDPRPAWIAGHCHPLPDRRQSDLRTYYCLPPDAAGS